MAKPVYQKIYLRSPKGGRLLRYRETATGAIVTPASRRESIRIRHLNAVRSYRSALRDYQEAKARKAGFRTFEAAKKAKPARFGGDWRARPEFRKAWQQVKKPTRTRRDAERRMRALEKLGRRIQRTWEHYVDAGYSPVEEGEAAAL